MAKDRSRIQIRCTESQYDEWEGCAKNDERDIVDWARRVLEIAAMSGLRIKELKERVLGEEKAEKPKGK